MSTAKICLDCAALDIWDYHCERTNSPTHPDTPICQHYSPYIHPPCHNPATTSNAPTATTSSPNNKQAASAAGHTKAQPTTYPAATYAQSTAAPTPQTTPSSPQTA